MEPRRHPVLFVFEAPDARGNDEGPALTRSLKSAGIPHYFYNWNTAEDFARQIAHATIAFDEELERFTSTADAPRVLLPLIHVSAHGNEHGIGPGHLAVSWEQLRALLVAFATPSNNFAHHTCLQSLCLSACDGIHAAKMYDFGEPYPCMAIVAPRTPIGWKSARDAFVTFYDMMITKYFTTDEALPAMNAAAGTPRIFTTILPPPLRAPSPG